MAGKSGQAPGSRGGVDTTAEKGSAHMAMFRSLHHFEHPQRGRSVAK